MNKAIVEQGEDFHAKTNAKTEGCTDLRKNDE